MDKLQQLKKELTSSPIFNYENYSSTYQLWYEVLKRVEELENE